MAVEYKDYYQSLGVARTATPDEIKQAFRKLARIHHPDVAKNKAAGEKKFKEINEAYEVLGDPEKRRRYDELGANWQEGAASPRNAVSAAAGPRSSAAPRVLNLGARASAISLSRSLAAAATASAPRERMGPPRRMGNSSTKAGMSRRTCW